MTDQDVQGDRGKQRTGGSSAGEEGGLGHGGVRGRTRVGNSVAGGKAACGRFGGESIGLSDTKQTG